MRSLRDVPYKSLLRPRYSKFLYCFTLLIGFAFCQSNLASGENFQCNGLYILSNTTGRITDHIGADTYPESITCYWQTQFNTSNDTYVTLLFHSFQLELDYDFLVIYEGNITNTGEAIAALTGYELPRPIMTTSSNILIQFSSDEYVAFAGFNLTYYLANCSSRCHNNGYCIGNTCHCDPGWSGVDCSVKEGCTTHDDCGGVSRGSCQGGYCSCKTGYYGPTCQQEYCEDLTLLTSASGTFSSQLTKGEYQTNQDCIWVIDPNPTVQALDPNDRVDSVTLYVNYIYTTLTDYVTVFGNNILDTSDRYNYTNYPFSDSDYDLYIQNSDNEIAIWAGVYYSDTAVVAQNGRLVLAFSSDEVAVRPGFELTYTSCLKSQCNFNGYCYRNSCICDWGWSGPNCDIPQVSCPNNCSDHGNCTTLCECDSGWTSVDCNIASDLQTAAYPVVSYSPYLSTIQVSPQGSSPTYFECRYSASIVYNVTIPSNVTSGSFVGISPSYSEPPMSVVDTTVYIFPAFNSSTPGTITLRFTYLNLTLNDTLTVYNGLSLGSYKLARMDATTSVSLVYPIVAKQPISLVLSHNMTNFSGTFVDESISFQVYFDIAYCDSGCGNGACVLGACQCNPGWTGDTCQTRICERNCSGNGLCVNGACQCNPGWSGDVCEAPTCRGNVTISNITTAVVSDHAIGYHYWPSVSCGFWFKGDPQTTLSLFFDTHQTQAYFDLIMIYDGPNKTSPLISKTENSLLPLPIRSSGSDLFLSFFSDTRSVYLGFTVTVYSNQLCANDTSCITSPEGLCYSSDFDSPNPTSPPKCLCDGPSCTSTQDIIRMNPDQIYQMILPDWEWQYFSYYVDKPAGELSINFSRAYNQSGFPFPEIYINFGSLPTHDQYLIFKWYMRDQGDENPTMTRIANPGVGTYYIGVYGRRIEGRDNNTFVLTAKASCPTACSEHGYCDENNICHCWDNLCWDGYDCSTSLKNCSFVTTCSAGLCDCGTNFTGSNCEEALCIPECEHGKCKAGSGGAPNWCDCTGTPYGGDQCQTWLNYTCTPACMNGGICVGTNSPCDCSQTGGYFGWRCEQYTCTDICEFGECVAPDVCLCYYGATSKGCNPAPITASAFVLTVVAVVIGVFACVVVLTTVVLIVKLVKATSVVRPIIGQAGADERTMK